jgi:hypothetical protein
MARHEESKFPISAPKPVARNDFYVDDVLSGSDCIHTVVKMQKQLIELLKSGGFQLQKYAKIVGGNSKNQQCTRSKHSRN